MGIIAILALMIFFFSARSYGMRIFWTRMNDILVYALSKSQSFIFSYVFLNEKSEIRGWKTLDLLKCAFP